MRIFMPNDPSGRLQLAQAGEQFGVEDGGSGGSANGVVREHGELPVEHRAGAQAADGHGHAVAAIAVEARLRAIVLRRPLDGLIGSGGQSLAGERAELGPGGEKSSRVARPSLLPSLMDTLSVWPSSTATRLHCALMRAASGLRRGLQLAEQLERLGFHFSSSLPM
jgi:hypothetical protein